MSVVALTGVLALAACAGDEEDVAGGGDGGANEASGADGEAKISSVDELVIGLVPSQDQEGIVENAEKVADELSEALDGFPVDIFVADNYLGVIQGMQTGDVQLVMSGPVGMIQAEDEAGGTSILQSLRDGEDTYVTQWFTSDPDTYCDDEPVKDDEGFTYCNGIYDDEAGEFADYGPVGVDALKKIENGTTVSFVDEGSASGYYFPQTQLNELGIEVDAQFAGGHDQSVLNVYNDQIEVGTSFDDARNNVVEENDDVGEKLTVFAWAGPIPNDGIVASKDLTEEEQKTIADAFMSYAGDGDLSEGDPLFDTYEIEGLTEADDEALEKAREVYEEFGGDE